MSVDTTPIETHHLTTHVTLILTLWSSQIITRSFGKLTFFPVPTKARIFVLYNMVTIPNPPLGVKSEWRIDTNVHVRRCSRRFFYDCRKGRR